MEPRALPPSVRWLLGLAFASCGTSRPPVVGAAGTDAQVDAPAIAEDTRPSCTDALDRAEPLERQLVQGDPEGFTRAALDREIERFRACAGATPDCAALRRRITSERMAGLRITLAAVSEVYRSFCTLAAPDTGSPRCGFGAVESSRVSSAANLTLRDVGLWPSGAIGMSLHIESSGGLTFWRGPRAATRSVPTTAGSQGYFFTLGPDGAMTSGRGIGNGNATPTETLGVVVDRYGAGYVGAHFDVQLTLMSFLEPAFPEPSSIFDRGSVSLRGDLRDAPRLRALTVAGDDLLVTAGRFVGEVLPAPPSARPLPTEGLVGWRHNGGLLLGGRFDVRWTRPLSLTDHVADLHLAGDSRAVYLAGSFLPGADPGGGALAVVEGRSLFVAAFDLQGNTLWVHTYGAREGNALGDLTVGADGTIALSFTCTGALDAAGTTLASRGGSDLCALLLDRDGAVLHGVRVGSALDDVGVHAVTRQDGSLVLAGNVRGPVRVGDIDVPARGGLDVLLATLSADGSVRAACSLGSPADDHVTAIALGGDTVLIGGDFTAAADLLDGTYAPEGGSDVFLLRARGGGTE